MYSYFTFSELYIKFAYAQILRLQEIANADEISIPGTR